MLKTTLIKRMNIIIYIKHPVLGTRVMLPILEKQHTQIRPTHQGTWWQGQQLLHLQDMLWWNETILGLLLQ